MKNLILYIFLPLILLSAACTKKVTVKTPEFKDAVVIYSNTDCGDTIRVILTKSTGILKYKPNNYIQVKDATVTLYVNGLFAQTIPYNLSLSEYTSSIVAEPGKTYKLTVEAPGMQMAEAEAIAPVPVPINVLSIKDSLIQVDQFGFIEKSYLKLAFNDPPGQRNYYLFEFYRNNPQWGSVYGASYVCMEVNDPIIDREFNLEPGGGNPGMDCIGDMIYFSNDLFKGATKTLDIAVYSDDTRAIPIPPDNTDTAYSIMKLTRLSEARYKYVKSLQAASQADGNPFAEPVNVFSNVKNGYGSFTIADPFYYSFKR